MSYSMNQHHRFCVMGTRLYPVQTKVFAYLAHDLWMNVGLRVMQIRPEKRRSRQSAALPTRNGV